jgi:hypothetical protein
MSELMKHVRNNNWFGFSSCYFLEENSLYKRNGKERNAQAINEKL